MKKGAIGTVILFMTLIGLAYAEELVVVAGPHGGDLFLIGEKLSALLTDNELTIRMAPSDGDVESIASVIDGSADLAVVDSLRAYEASLGIGSLSGAKKKGLSAVAVVGLTVEHFILRGPIMDGEGITDFADKIIYIGADGDPSRHAALAILASVGVDSFSEAGQDWDPLTSAEMMIDGAIDGAIYSGAVPLAAVSHIASIMGDNVAFLDVPDGILAGMRKTWPVWFPFVIPEGTYQGMDEPYKTVARPILLVAARTLDKETIKRLLIRLFSDSNRETLLGLPYPISEPMSLTYCPIKLHPGAVEYFRQKGY